MCIGKLYILNVELLLSRMFEEKVDLSHKINVESIKPHDLKRPSEHVPEQYEDTPEYRQSLNLKV